MNKIYDFESGILPIEEKRFDEIVYNDIRLSICEAFLALDDNCQVGVFVMPSDKDLLIKATVYHHPTGKKTKGYGGS